MLQAAKPSCSKEAQGTQKQRNMENMWKHCCLILYYCSDDFGCVLFDSCWHIHKTALGMSCDWSRTCYSKQPSNPINMVGTWRLNGCPGPPGIIAMFSLQKCLAFIHHPWIQNFLAATCYAARPTIDTKRRRAPRLVVRSRGLNCLCAIVAPWSENNVVVFQAACFSF